MAIIIAQRLKNDRIPIDCYNNNFDFKKVIYEQELFRH